MTRLPTGGVIDRTKPLRFWFDGRPYTGYAGDTLASALLANGVHLTARSFKYHRPRGIFSAGIEEPSCFVELDGANASANQPVTMVPLTEGLHARSVNCWPSASFDLGAVVQVASRVLPASFYYKTFKWPNWHVFEPAIRRAAGLAAVPEDPPEGRYENRHWHCDVLVAGAGPAGLTAALHAARQGQRVVIADENPSPGGSVRAVPDGPAAEWVAATVQELDSLDNVRFLRNATVWGYREHNLVMVAERRPQGAPLLGRNWRIRAGHVIVATGAIERALVFEGNERPGVMLSNAAGLYATHFAVRPGNKVVIFTNNSSVYPTAQRLLAAGIEIGAIVDARRLVSEAERALVPNVKILPDAQVIRSHGYSRVTGATVRRANGQTFHLSCDLLAVSGGWTPTIHLFSQSRGTIRYCKDIESFVPDTPAQSTSCVGAAAGTLTRDDALKGLFDEELPYDITPLWRVDGLRAGAKAFVDIQNDVTVDDILLADREGFGAIEHVKRYTTGGMAMDQGKTGNLNIIGTLAQAQNQELPEIGTTTYRAPYSPVEFGAIAGVREGSVVLPYRHTPLTGWNINRGAVMYEAGARWQRPGYYPQDGESFQDSVNREADCVRTGVGVYDGAPLGTFELKGPDVATFLDRLYTNVFSNLEIGQGRYGLMLTDDGLILDDGVSFRLGPCRFLMSTSTGNADAVLHHMEKLLRTEWTDLTVWISTLTSQWSNATVCGPQARDVLHALGTDINLSPEAFPFMSVRDGQVAGFPARIARVSFTGELSFEINVASRHLAALWDKIMAAGAPFGIQPIGSEANHVLRVEKGFLSPGHEVDGTTDPYDLGMGWVMSKKKDDFIGKRSVMLRRSKPGPRRELVGIQAKDPSFLIPEGAPLTPNGRALPSEGLVTAYVWSVTNQRGVGLALLEDGRNRMGQSAFVRIKENVVEVTVTEPCFHDPDGNRLRG